MSESLQRSALVLLLGVLTPKHMCSYSQIWYAGRSNHRSLPSRPDASFIYGPPLPGRPGTNACRRGFVSNPGLTLVKQ